MRYDRVAYTEKGYEEKVLSDGIGMRTSAGGAVKTSQQDVQRPWGHEHLEST